MVKSDFWGDLSGVNLSQGRIWTFTLGSMVWPGWSVHKRATAREKHYCNDRIPAVSYIHSDATHVYISIYRWGWWCSVVICFCPHWFDQKSFNLTGSHPCRAEVELYYGCRTVPWRHGEVGGLTKGAKACYLKDEILFCQVSVDGKGLGFLGKVTMLIANGHEQFPRLKATPCHLWFVSKLSGWSINPRR